MRATRSFVKVQSLVLAMGVLVVGATAYADIGRGTLLVPGVLDTGVFGLKIGVPYVVWIVNVSVTEVGDPAPETIPVWVKSSHGNTMLAATRATLPNVLVDYNFTYTPPAISVGDAFDACGVAIVSYGNGPEGGYDAREECSPSWLCEQYPPVPGLLQFVNAYGYGIPCLPTSVEGAPWSLIKKLYR
jgi:hypothetical protein